MKRSCALFTRYTDEIPVEQVAKQFHLEPMAAYSRHGKASGAGSPIKQRFVSLFSAVSRATPPTRMNLIESCFLVSDSSCKCAF